MHTFTHNVMSSLLNLQGLIIYKIEENKEKIKVKIGQPRKPKHCPYCKSTKFNKHGKGRNREMNHGLAPNGKNIYLLWNGKRFKCKKCFKTWTLAPPKYLVEGKQRSTKFCRKQALRTLQFNSFNNTDKQTGLSYGVLKEELHNFMKNKPLVKIPNGDLIIAIDEHSSFKHKLSTTIALIYPEKKLLGIIPKATSKELVQWVENNMTYEQRLRVKEIGMDMTKSQRKQLKELFPKAKFVMDHFHVIAYLNRLIAQEYRFMIKYGNLTKEQKDMLPTQGKGLGVVRLLYQSGNYWKKDDYEKIRNVFKIMPRIAELWYAKEEVRAIYRESLDKCEARERWQFVFTLLPKIARNTLQEKLEEILNYFDNKTTTGFIEGIHTKIKLLKRLSYGLKNPQVYVEKLELGFVESQMLISDHTF